MDNNTRIFKKGEHLFKAGDKVTTVFAIQSGSVSVYLPRPKQNIEMYVAGNSQFIGEHALFGVATHTFSAVATSETKVFEVPADFMKGQIEACSQMVKIFAKSMGERSKFLTNELKSYRLERDNSPCPADQVAKAFGVFFHVAHHLGKMDAKTKKTTADWRQMKSYAQRVFMEPTKRLEQVLNIFVKLKYAEIQMVKSEDDPKAPEELGYIHISDLTVVEQFFEYYQYYFFKSGKSDLLKVDETCYQLVNVILREAEQNPSDRNGVTRIDYSKIVEASKKDLGINLNNTHFERLEQKGLYVKRATQEKGGVVLSFDTPEFNRVFLSWKILREIDKWNERGFVDIHEIEVVRRIGNSSGKTCISCGGEILESNRFCPGCGAKLAA